MYGLYIYDQTMTYLLSITSILSVTYLGQRCTMTECADRILRLAKCRLSTSQSHKNCTINKYSWIALTVIVSYHASVFVSPSLDPPPYPECSRLTGGTLQSCVFFLVIGGFLVRRLLVSRRCATSCSWSCPGCRTE